jgi:heme exporter protein A
MDDFTLEAQSLTKVFGRRVIFNQISFELSKGQSLSITGPNGSGKTTLAKILSGLLSPTGGSVLMKLGEDIVKPEARRNFIGFVSPYLQLYDEFTGFENLLLATRIRGLNVVNAPVEGLLTRVGLLDRKDDRVATYSTGMKQRLKFAFALLHHPVLLILDEPMSTLDESGVEMVRAIIEEQKRTGLLVMATNDAHEASMCDQRIQLGGGSAARMAGFP